MGSVGLRLRVLSCHQEQKLKELQESGAASHYVVPLRRATFH